MLPSMARPNVCPICRKPLPDLAADAPFRPFCSERCRAIDLGGWLEGKYRISRPVEEEDLDSGLTKDEDA
jgi:endogenous inhibitor of DNA gyrase (YacG/DUF329 family)